MDNDTTPGETSTSNSKTNKELEKLVKKIRDSAVKEEHILHTLEKIATHQERRNAERFEKMPPYTFESYRYNWEETRDKRKSPKQGITLLHLALSCNRDRVASWLIRKAPKLSKTERSDDLFKGQTPFHIAVARKKHGLVDEMMTTDLKDGVADVLSGKARGSALKGTIMMGETPLSIAVLNQDEQMTELLLDNRADITLGDSRGNTVLHTIVTYTYFFPEKNLEVEKPHFKEATKCLLSKIGFERLRTLFHVKNKKGAPPLQLACKKNLYKVFDYFINLDNIYRFSPDIWGVTDTFRYDITEIDTIHWREAERKEIQHEVENVRLRSKETEEDKNCANCCPRVKQNLKVNKRPSALQAISRLSFKAGSRFMSCDIIEEIIIKKWDYYKWWFRGFGVFHLIWICYLTYETLDKTREFSLEENYSGSHQVTRFLIFGIFSLIIGLLYITQEIVRRVYHRQQWFPSFRLHHNTIYRFMFLLFGLTLFIDSCWNFKEPNNYIRYLALFFGWFGMIFFLRGIEYCSYHSIVFLEIITGDILKFLPVMIATLIPFTAAAYESYGARGSGFYNYAESVLFLFEWMNGFGDTDVQKDAKPDLSISVFVLFAVFGNIILLQTLIALMTNNHINDINRLYLLRVQRLSIIVFFESILPKAWTKSLGDKETFENSNGQKQIRYHLQVNRADGENIEEKDSPKSVIERLLKGDFPIYPDNHDTLDTTIASGISTVQID